MKKIPNFFLNNCFVGEEKQCDKKFRIWETPKLSTDADRRIDTKRIIFFGCIDGRTEARTYRAKGGGSHVMLKR